MKRERYINSVIRRSRYRCIVLHRNFVQFIRHWWWGIIRTVNDHVVSFSAPTSQRRLRCYFNVIGVHRQCHAHRVRPCVLVGCVMACPRSLDRLHPRCRVIPDACVRKTSRHRDESRLHFYRNTDDSQWNFRLEVGWRCEAKCSYFTYERYT